MFKRFTQVKILFFYCSLNHFKPFGFCELVWFYLEFINVFFLLNEFLSFFFSFSSFLYFYCRVSNGSSVWENFFLLDSSYCAFNFNKFKEKEETKTGANELEVIDTFHLNYGNCDVLN